MWVFGYGSLIWKVDFPYERRLVGYIKGYVRRFWQGSEDHRGVPGKPGRVVTLVQADDPDETVWGVAYEITPEKQELVRAHLDHREKGGYEIVTVTFYPAAPMSGEQTMNSSLPFDLDIYVGATDNPYYLGPANIFEMAQQIHTAVGPSGPNVEYLFRLADATKAIVPPGVHDRHLEELVTAVKQLISEEDILRCKTS